MGKTRKTVNKDVCFSRFRQITWYYTEYHVTKGKNVFAEICRLDKSDILKTTCINELAVNK